MTFYFDTFTFSKIKQQLKVEKNNTKTNQRNIKKKKNKKATLVWDFCINKEKKQFNIKASKYLFNKIWNCKI